MPIGYRLEDRQLVVEPVEADIVRLIFERYLALRSIGALVEDLAECGVRTKVRTYKDGRQVGGILFTKGMLGHFLKNPIYLGKVPHRGELHDGQHDAIIDVELWDAVQALSKTNGSDRRLGRKLKAPSLLTGLLVDPEGRPMTPVHTTRQDKRYRYYVSRLAIGEDSNSAWRLPAGDLDRLVIELIRDWLLSGEAGEGAECAQEIACRLVDRRGLATKLPVMSTPEQREVLLSLHPQIAVHADSISIKLGDDVELRCATRLVRRGMDLRLALPPDGGAAAREPDAVLLRLVAHAQAAKTLLVDGKPAASASVISGSCSASTGWHRIF